MEDDCAYGPSLDELRHAQAPGDGRRLAAAALEVGRVQVERGQHQEARCSLHSASQLARSVGWQDGHAQAEHELALLTFALGEWPAAQTHALAAIDLGAGESGGREAELRNLLAGLYHSSGQYDSALQELAAVRRLHREGGSPAGGIKALCNMGVILTSLGRYPDALDHLTEAYALLRSLPEGGPEFCRSRGSILVNIGNIYLDMGDHAKARGYFLEALSDFQSLGDENLQATCRLNLANAEQEQGDLGQAHLHYVEALSLARRAANLACQTSALEGLGRILLAWDRAEDALETLREAEHIALSTEDVEGQLGVLVPLGEVYVRQGALVEAIDTWQRARHLADEIGRPKMSCDALRSLYQLYARTGQTALAFAHLEELYGRERRILNAEVDERVQEMTARFEVERAQHQAEINRLRMVSAEEARAAAESEVRDRTRSLELAQIEVVTRLAVAAEFRDDTTGDHTLRVGQLSAAIGARLGLPAEDTELLRIAARLHDVGKIGIPDSILLKEGPLTPDEYCQMQRHTGIGQRILAGGQSRLLQMAETIAQNHHEHWNGGGYPAGLSGEDIPLVARIVAVADVYDALTHRRPYKAAWPRDRALAELVAQAGRQFDPAVVHEALVVLGHGTGSGSGAEEGPLLVRASV